ncbi:protein of unknown function [Streptococcus thermophilus]|nr:protein of unknown function [Streptococcus thermophilus]CAD0130343.1 protein of unknown function [Streptococcus thermophilus]
MFSPLFVFLIGLLDDRSSQIENLKYIQIIFLRAHLHTMKIMV